MNEQVRLAADKLLQEFSEYRSEVHSFESGKAIVDIWVGDNFFVFEIHSENEIGASMLRPGSKDTMGGSDIICDSVESAISFIRRSITES